MATIVLSNPELVRVLASLYPVMLDESPSAALQEYAALHGHELVWDHGTPLLSVEGDDEAQTVLKAAAQVLAQALRSAVVSPYLE